MKLILVVSIIVAYFISLGITRKTIHKLGERKSVNPYRVEYIIKTLNIALLTFFAITAFSILGIEYSQISLFLSSVFAVVGVALFAQWSILSNITASLIIFFGFPYRVGDHIHILDKDDEIKGIIEDISLFHVLIKRDENLITYPNNLILQKAVVKLPPK